MVNFEQIIARINLEIVQRPTFDGYKLDPNTGMEKSPGFVDWQICVTKDGQGATIGHLYLVCLEGEIELKCVSNEHPSHPADMPSINIVKNYIESRFPSGYFNHEQTARAEPVENTNGPLPAIFVPGEKKKIDDLCISWAGRGYFSGDMNDFLSDFYKNEKIYITRRQFKQYLQDAGKRGLVKKIDRRWKPKKST